MSSPILEPYDAFTGDSLDTSKWYFLQYPIPDQEPWVCREPRARVTASEGRLEVEVDRFELQHPLQVIDNCKLVLLSTETFPVPEKGILVVTGEMSAEGVGTKPHDWQDGFASLILIDLATGLVFDICANSESVGAIHEQLPINPDVPCFTHLVEAPLVGATTTPGQTHECRITLDAAGRTATWSVDGHEVFRAAGIDIPTSVALGMGIFTLRPVNEGGSNSLHGQGFKASWSNLTVTSA